LLLGLGIGLVLVVGLSAAAIRTTRFQKWYRPPVIVLPDDDDVAEMVASLRTSQIGLEAVPEFVVPAEHVPAVLAWLRPAEYIEKPWRIDQFDELGEVVIRTRDGREVRLRFYWAGKNPAVLTADGEDQFWGRGIDDKGHPCDGGIRLAIAVREAHKASQR
jgi:hypothetical protein